MYYACQGTKDEQPCMELFFDQCPKECPVCGSKDIKQGIQNMNFAQKSLMQALERKKSNDKLTKYMKRSK